MKRSALTVSVIFHIAMLLFAIFGMPFVTTRDFVIPPAPIAIDFVDIGLVTMTDKIQQGGEQPGAKKDDKTPPPMPNQPKKAQSNKDDDVAMPKPEPKKEQPKDKDDASKDKKEDKNIVDEAALPKKEDKKKKDDADKAKQQEKVKKEEVAKKDKAFKSVLKNLMDEEDTNNGGEADKGKSTGNDGINAPLGDKMTVSEQDAVRAQIEKCWNVPYGAKEIEGMIVEIEMEINPDRTVRTAKITDTSKYNSDNFYRAVADSALRAVKSPACSPLQLPPDKYDLWKNTTIRFNPKDMY